MNWIKDRVTVYRTNFRIPPWIGCGPVKFGDKVQGISFHAGNRCIAFHKKLAPID